MTVRYLIVHKKHGIFLGAVMGTPIFASNNSFQLTSAYAFDSSGAAYEFIMQYMAESQYEMQPVSVDTESQYATAADMLKANLSEYMYDIVDFMPMQSKSFH